jgi:starvation-inducible DNA-binding protein
MKTGFSEESRKLIASKLEGVFVDTYALYLKTQNAHWNYVGKEFFSLHLLFEKQYQDMANALDEIAERVRALDFFVTASFAFFQQKTTISIQDSLLPSKMVEDLVSGHEILISHLRQIGELAEREKDVATVDLLVKRLAEHEKFLWMLKNYV